MIYDEVSNFVKKLSIDQLHSFVGLIFHRCGIFITIPINKDKIFNLSISTQTLRQLHFLAEQRHRNVRHISNNVRQLSNKEVYSIAKALFKLNNFDIRIPPKRVAIVLTLTRCRLIHEANYYIHELLREKKIEQLRKQEEYNNGRN